MHCPQQAQRSVLICQKVATNQLMYVLTQCQMPRAGAHTKAVPASQRGHSLNGRQKSKKIGDNSMAEGKQRLFGIEFICCHPNNPWALVCLWVLCQHWDYSSKQDTAGRAPDIYILVEEAVNKGRQTSRHYNLQRVS